MSNTSDDACMKTKKDFAFNVHVVKEYVKKMQGLKTALKNMLMGLNFTNISRLLKSLVSTYF